MNGTIERQAAQPGAVVPSGSLVTPGGSQGPVGSAGASGPAGPIGPTAVSADAGNIATLGSDSLIYVAAQQGVPTGAVIDFTGSAAPTGWLLAQGQAVSRTGTTAALFAVIGTTFGPGDGSSTYNLPDLRSRVSVGAGQGTGLTDRVLAATGGEENHVLLTAELAAHSHTATQGNHTHSATQSTHNHGDPGHTHSSSFASQGAASGGGFGAAYGTGGNFAVVSSSSGTGIQAASAGAITVSTVSAGAITVANTGSGTGHNTMPPYLVLNKIIKL